MSFFGSWFTFAIFWYLIAFIHGDLNNGGETKSESIISANTSHLINKTSDTNLFQIEKIEAYEHKPCGKFLFDYLTCKKNNHHIL